MQSKHRPSSTPATRYRITHHSQECACAECGTPLYVGDHVHELEEEAFCSTTCVQRYLAGREQRS